MRIESALRLIFPPACIACGARVDSDFGLCPDCWPEVRFLTGLVCDACGAPLPGEEGGGAVQCDDCLASPRPWARGRSAVLYAGRGRDLILQFKHGDRLDLARPMAGWLARAGAPLLAPDMLIAPVPLHWRRFFTRRYNQSALLARALARATGQEDCPDLLVRHRATASQEGRTREERAANLAGALSVNRRQRERIKGRAVLIVDDVMTSGATFAEATRACLQAGALSVSVLALARVAKDA